MVTRPDELGTGQVWSDHDKPIIHFGSPPQPSAIVSADGKPIAR